MGCGNDGQNRLDATALLAGFANPILFAILALLVVGQGMYQTGAVEKAAEFMGGLLHLAPKYALSVTLVLAALSSAFLNNTPVVVIFIPVLSALATRLDLSAGNVLMPLSFITILGGMTTLIGSSANLIAASVAHASGGPVIRLFDFARAPDISFHSLKGDSTEREIDFPIEDTHGKIGTRTGENQEYIASWCRGFQIVRTSESHDSLRARATGSNHTEKQ